MGQIAKRRTQPGLPCSAVRGPSPMPNSPPSAASPHSRPASSATRPTPTAPPPGAQHHVHHRRHPPTPRPPRRRDHRAVFSATTSPASNAKGGPRLAKVRDRPDQPVTQQGTGDIQHDATHRHAASLRFAASPARAVRRLRRLGSGDPGRDRRRAGRVRGERPVRRCRVRRASPRGAQPRGHHRRGLAPGPRPVPAGRDRRWFSLPEHLQRWTKGRNPWAVVSGLEKRR